MATESGPPRNHDQGGDQLVITYRAPASLTPDPSNARTHDRRQVAQIARSITEFGFSNPILIDEAGLIIAGHGRLLAAKSLGLAEVPTIVLPGLSDVQKRALRLADNKIALNAGWDFDLLKVELQQLSVGDMEFDHRVGCGDGRDLKFLRAVVGDGAMVDAAFLDPPYNVKISGNAVSKGTHREFAMASGEMSDAAFAEFLKDSLEACVAVSRDGAVHFVCMDWRHMAPLEAVGAEVYGDLLNLCVWNKSNAGMGSLYRSKHELVFVFRVGEASHFNAVELGKHGRNRTNVWDYASVNSFRGSRRGDLALHPTVKPAGMVADAIKDVTRQGDLVLDTFLGSGTTLIAAERAGRRFRGLDIDPAYVDVAIERWTALTGREARLDTEPRS